MRVVFVFFASVVLASCSAGTVPQMLPASSADLSSLYLTRQLGGFKTIFRFNGKDGAQPYAGLVNVGGTLYGTTTSSSFVAGTVFSITPNGTQKVLYRFTGPYDGDLPYANLILVNGKLFGTTQLGGAHGEGTVFSITTSGTEKVIYSFKGGSDGAQPQAPLLNVNGTLYGTTVSGGATYGTVFSITTSGFEKVLHRFKGDYVDGEYPQAGLTAVNGTLYGTTLDGGTAAIGTVFSITTKGFEKVIHSFNGVSGGYPGSGLTYHRGALYGTTSAGGSQFDNGTVFKVTQAGSLKVIYYFKGGTDGGGPNFGRLLNVNGVLYGTTPGGGSSGRGVVFKVTTAGVETVLHTFNGNDGEFPNGTLVNVKGVLYGTTSGYPNVKNGTVFSILP